MDRVAFRHTGGSQAKDANAARSELCPDRLRVSCSTAAIAGPTPPIKAMPSLDGVDVTVMMTPARFGTIRRAASRDVRKYDLAYVSMGRTKSSTSNPTSGTPWSFVLRMPTALNEMSMRPVFATTASRCLSMPSPSRASSTLASADPPVAAISRARPSTGAPWRPMRNSFAPSRANA